MRAYTTAKLGPKREMTPDGWLVCYDVPIATTGDLIYYKGELRDDTGKEVVEAGPDNQIIVTRTADQLFRPETIQSAHAKPATYNHPAGKRVTHANYSQVGKGVMVNPRRGTGAFDNALIADIVFYDKPTIDAINAGVVREVSPGYDAGYVQTAPGKAEQVNLVYNHVAVLRDGRGGSRCAIGDQKPMTLKERLAALKATLTEAVRTGDSAPALAAIEAAEADVTTPPPLPVQATTTNDAVLTALNGISDRLAMLEKAEKDRADAIRTADEAARAAAATVDEATQALLAQYPNARAQEIVAHAEILTPGVKLEKVGTVDAAGATVDVASALLDHQRATLTRAYAVDGKPKEAIKAVLAGREPAFATMDAVTVDAIFTGASVIVAAANNAVASAVSTTTDTTRLTPAQRMAAGIEKTWGTPANH